MVPIDTNEPVLSTTSSYNIGQLKDIHPRLCLLHKWSHYDGYGIHLTCNEHWRGLHIDDIESNSPAESAGLLRKDVIFAVNGHSIENEDFFVILAFIQQELEHDQIRFLVLDPHSAELAQRYQININENNENCIRRETAEFIQNTNKSIRTMAQNSSQDANNASNPNTSLKSELRMCSIILRPSVEPIGISIKSDTDFSHIITQVQSNSPADRAGIEQDDCIISLNNTSLLHLPFEDVLYCLAKTRNEPKLDFLVARKSYLLKSFQNYLTLKTTTPVSTTANLIERNRSWTLPAIQTLEQISSKYNDEQSRRNQQQKIIIDERYDRLSLQVYSHLNVVKRKKKHGKILEGVGPATALRSSWSDTSEKTIDYSSIRSDLQGRRLDADGIKDTFNSLQVGMTNPSPKQKARRIPSVSFSDNRQRTAQSLSSIGRFHNSPKVLPRSNLTRRRNYAVDTPSPILKHKYTATIQSLPALSIWDQDNRSISQDNLQLATIPISELVNHGYELYHIKLMKPSETILVGFKLTKQTDPLQYIMTTIVEQSKADIAGLKVGDWLLKIDNNDIRLTDLQDVLRDIYRLFNSVGFVNMLIARKRPSVNKNQAASNKINVLSSVGLSNPIEDKNQNSPAHKEFPFNQSIDSNLDKIRHITLKQASGLYFNSFIPDHNDQIYVHFISNIQPISAAYRAGLRNHDHILTVNNVDVTNTKPEELRLMISKEQPIQLTVIKDSKYLEAIENFKRKETQTSLSSINSNFNGPQQSKELNTSLFTDDQGPVYIKHCIMKKEPSNDGLGFLLHYDNGFHRIDNVTINSPGYNSGLDNDDIILFVNKKNIQELFHADVTILLRSLVNSNQIVDLIVSNKKDIPRFKNYQQKNSIDWDMVLSKIYQDSPNKIQKEKKYSQVNQPTSPTVAPARICVLETTASHSGGFTLDGLYPPFTICKIEKDSSADKAGLQLNDVLVSVDGKPVLETNYEDTIRIIKEALQQKFVPIVVKQSSITRTENQSSLSCSSDDDDDDDDGNAGGDKPAHRATHIVQQYQKQRTKELSYALRLCHLNATNSDGTPASAFGFEIIGDPKYEYPIISRIEAKLPGERAGLQTDDILLKVNNRKTKGADIKKVKKAIEKAKRDGRLEMLVVDKDAFDYCKRTNKKFKEPYIKVKHIFPRTRSATEYHSLPLTAARAASASQESLDRLKNGSSSFTVNRLSTHCENEEHNLKPVTFDLPSTTNSLDSFSHDTSSKFIDSGRRLSRRKDSSSTIHNVSNITQGIQSETSPDESIINVVLNAINDFFHNTGSEKPFNPDYDIPPDRTNNSKTSTPLLSSIRFDQNLSEENPTLSHSHVTVHSHQSSGSYDYIRDPRRCVLKIDRNKGLGFVLSATGDYDHTITSVDKNSIAAAAGLQVNDEVLEINGVDIRNIKYEQVVDMLISTMQTNDTIEMYVINSHILSPKVVPKKRTNVHSLLNDNNNNNNNLLTAKRTTAASSDNFSGKNTKMSAYNTLKQQAMNTSYPDLLDQSQYLNKIFSRGLSGSVPVLSTGITASPKDFRSTKATSVSPKSSVAKVSKICENDAPVARLCRIRKFPSSPFYGFFLCGNPKKLGRVFVSDITKNSSAAVCGLRDGDRIIEVNGTNIQTLTYETILNKIKLHMEQHDLELLVLDKKSYRWYRRRKYSILSTTLPTIVRIEPIINEMNAPIIPL